MKKLMLKLFRDEEGQGLVEYALIMVFVVIAALAAASFLGLRTTNMINNAANKM
jgi:Flp pilus assembly pilin Flp